MDGTAKGGGALSSYLHSLLALLLLSIIFSIVALLLIPSALAAEKRLPGKFFDILYECNDDVCISGEGMNFSLYIQNKGTYDLQITEVEVLDRNNDSQVAGYRYEGLPKVVYVAEALGGIVVPTGKAQTIKMNTTVPSANLFGKFVFYVCLTNSIPNDDTVRKGRGIYENRNCYEDNFSIVSYGCGHNSNCRDDHYCLNTNCVPLSCKACEYAANHSCKRYDCCRPADCGWNEGCLNNSCRVLPCKRDEIVLNNSCTKLRCKDFEYALNGSCNALNCSRDEGYSNNSCKKLSCNFKEFIQDHKCQPLNCLEDEGYVNHKCAKLLCEGNQTIINHKCVDLECNFFQDAVLHECSYNKDFIVLFARDTGIWLIIIGLFIWNVLEFTGKAKKETFTGIVSWFISRPRDAIDWAKEKMGR